MVGNVRALRFDLMPLCNGLRFCPSDGTGVALVLRVLLNLRITFLFPSFPPTTELVRVRLPFLSRVVDILEEIQLSR